MGMFDYIDGGCAGVDYNDEKKRVLRRRMLDCVIPHDRLVQICSPCLTPIYVTIVDRFDELGEPTLRGDGAFGSTGR